MKSCTCCGRELQDDWAVCPLCGTRCALTTTSAKACGGFRVWKLAVVLLAVAAVTLVGFAVYVALDDAGVFKAPSSKPSTGAEAPSFFGEDTYGDLLEDELLGGWEDDAPVYTEEQEALLQSYADAGTYIGNAYVNDKIGFQLAFDPSLLVLDKLYVESFNAEPGMKSLYWGENEEMTSGFSVTVDVPYASIEEMAKDWGDAAEEWYEDPTIVTDAVYGERRMAGRTFYTCVVEATDAEFTEYNFYAVTELDGAVLQMELYTETEEDAAEILRWIASYGGVSTGAIAAA